MCPPSNSRRTSLSSSKWGILGHQSKRIGGIGAEPSAEFVDDAVVGGQDGCRLIATLNCHGCSIDDQVDDTKAISTRTQSPINFRHAAAGLCHCSFDQGVPVRNTAGFANLDSEPAALLKEVDDIDEHRTRQCIDEFGFHSGARRCPITAQYRLRNRHDVEGAATQAGSFRTVGERNLSCRVDCSQNDCARTRIPPFETQHGGCLKITERARKIARRRQRAGAGIAAEFAPPECNDGRLAPEFPWGGGGRTGWIISCLVSSSEPRSHWPGCSACQPVSPSEYPSTRRLPWSFITIGCKGSHAARHGGTSCSLIVVRLDGGPFRRPHLLQWRPQRRDRELLRPIGCKRRIRHFIAMSRDCFKAIRCKRGQCGLSASNGRHVLIAQEQVVVGWSPFALHSRIDVAHRIPQTNQRSTHLPALDSLHEHFGPRRASLAVKKPWACEIAEEIPNR